MTKTFCDICRKEYSGGTGWVFAADEREKGGLISLCAVLDCCPACKNKTKNINVQHILIEYWKSLVEKDREVV